MNAVRMLMKTLVINALLWAPLALADIGTIEKVGVGSTVKVTRAGAVVRLKAGDDLKSGDEVGTDANTAVDIRLEDETLIRLGVNSSYKVQEDSKIHALVHRLLSGVVRVLVKPTDRDHTDPHIKFRMYTQEGTIGVRGTEFVVTRNGNTTEIKGLDGEVLFGAAEADLSHTANLQMVTRGFQSSIAAGAKTAAKPEKFDLKKYLDEVNGKNSAAFGPLAGGGGAAKASRYERATVAAPVAVQVTAKPNSNGAYTIPSPVKEAAPTKAVALDPAVVQDDFLAAVVENNISKAKIALKEGARINEKSSKSQGHTALQISLTSSKNAANANAEMDMFVFLVHAGADVDAVDENGLTPLMFAAQNKVNIEFVRALVYGGGAELDIEKDGKTAADMAKANGYEEMAVYLNSKEAETDHETAIADKADKKAEQAKALKGSRHKAK
jgi:hypothetical protein